MPDKLAFMDAMCHYYTKNVLRGGVKKYLLDQSCGNEALKVEMNKHGGNVRAFSLERQSYRQTDGQKHTQTGKQRDRHADRQTDRQTDK